LSAEQPEPPDERRADAAAGGEARVLDLPALLVMVALFLAALALMALMAPR
jgi:hypothetical protein